MFSAHVWVQEHPGTGDPLGTAAFWNRFLRDSFQVWQSGGLQLALQFSLAAYLVYKGASQQSKDSGERLEALVRAACDKIGVYPQEVEQGLPESSRQATAVRPQGRSP